MKTLFLGFAVTVAVLFSTFAQAASIVKAQKILGECLMTKEIVLRSKWMKKGTTATNQTVRFTISHNAYEGQDAYYDNVSMGFSLQDPTQCPTLGCEYSTIAKKSYDNPIDAPMVNTTKMKINTAEKLEVLFKAESYEWTKLTYDFKKKIGRYESREKISDWGGIFTKTVTDDHLVREIRNCTFTGPVNLDPGQP